MLFFFLTPWVALSLCTASPLPDVFWGFPSSHLQKSSSRSGDSSISLGDSEKAVDSSFSDHE
jgi:hypothetical protein